MLFEKVKALCKERGISIAALEAETDIGNGTIGRWRESSPKVSTLKKVANYLGCSIDELLTDSEGDSDGKGI